MRHLKDFGFVIKRTNFFDSDKFVTIFTKNHGKLDVLAKGIRKINSRRSPHIELLNLIKFQTIKTRVNYILTDVEVIDAYCDMKVDYEKVGTVFLICELVNKLCPENVKHEDIFFLIQKTVGEIRGDNAFSSLLDFQVKLLTILGFWDAKRKVSSSFEIDRFIENVIEKKIRTKLFFKL